MNPLHRPAPVSVSEKHLRYRESPKKALEEHYEEKVLHLLGKLRQSKVKYGLFVENRESGKTECAKF